jgi:hypothetical protein
MTAGSVLEKAARLEWSTIGRSLAQGELPSDAGSIQHLASELELA